MAVVERPRRWTRAEYYRLGDAGFFEDERVELSGRGDMDIAATDPTPLLGG